MLIASYQPGVVVLGEFHGHDFINQCDTRTLVNRPQLPCPRGRAETRQRQLDSQLVPRGVCAGMLVKLDIKAVFLSGSSIAGTLRKLQVSPAIGRIYFDVPPK